jgi:hypothetical protein
MPKFPGNIISEDGHIQSFEALVCGDDNVAIAAAKRLVDGHDVELWQADRKVIKLTHKVG